MYSPPSNHLQREQSVEVLGKTWPCLARCNLKENLINALTIKVLNPRMIVVTLVKTQQFTKLNSVKPKTR